MTDTPRPDRTLEEIAEQLAYTATEHCTSVQCECQRLAKADILRALSSVQARTRECRRCDGTGVVQPTWDSKGVRTDLPAGDPCDCGWLNRQFQSAAENVIELPSWLRAEPLQPSPAPTGPDRTLGEQLQPQLATVRQELADAAMEINCAGPVAHRIRILKAEYAAQLATVRRDTLREAADLAANTAVTIRNMAQAFVASSMQAELAVVRAEALEEFARSLRTRADEQEPQR